MRAQPAAGEPPKVLGYDAAGVVEAVGPEASLFKPGDEVFYAGSIMRPGTNAEFHLVDERIVGRKPKSLSFAQAAAMPLTSITAWELLFDRLAVAPGNTRRRPRFADHRRRRRRRLDADPARAPPHSLDGDRHRLAPADARLVPEARRASRHRSLKADPGAAQVHRTRARRADRRPDEHAGSPARHYRGDRAAGQVRADRRSQGARHQPVQGQVGLRALGIDVHALDRSKRRT